MRSEQSRGGGTTYKPSEMAQGILDIPSGGDPLEVARSIIEGTVTEYVDPLLTTIKSGKFQNCYDLQTFIAHNVTLVYGGAFNDDNSTPRYLLNLAFPKIATVSGYRMQNWKKMKGVDFTLLTNIPARMAEGNTFWDTLVLRSPTMVTLAATNALNSSRFVNNNYPATIYVPNDLISSYQSATNWSTILGYTDTYIKSIESTHTDPDAPIDLTIYYLDGTEIPT